jgi:glucokinase
LNARGSPGTPKARRLVAGVDLGGTKIQTVVSSPTRIVGSARLPTPRTDAEGVIEAIEQSIRMSLDNAGASDGVLGAIGVGTPGEIETAEGVVSLAANVPGFSDRVELGPRLSSRLGGVPVRIDNDVRVAVLGEARRGAGRPYRDFLGVFVGTGVGGGLVLDGELREGRGAAGEIGHAVVRDGGRRCSCGRRGCVEAYAGRGRIEARARRLVARGRKTILFDLMKKKGRERLTSGVIARALERGDDMTVALIDEAVWALGLALASAQNVLDVEAVIIGGGLGDRLGQPFAKRVAEAMQPHLFVAEHPPAVLSTELGDLSGATGAAVLAWG